MLDQPLQTNKQLIRFNTVDSLVVKPKEKRAKQDFESSETEEEIDETTDSEISIHAEQSSGRCCGLKFSLKFGHLAYFCCRRTEYKSREKLKKMKENFKKNHDELLRKHKRAVSNWKKLRTMMILPLALKVNLRQISAPVVFEKRKSSVKWYN